MPPKPNSSMQEISGIYLGLGLALPHFLRGYLRCYIARPDPFPHKSVQLCYGGLQAVPGQRDQLPALRGVLGWRQSRSRSPAEPRHPGRAEVRAR